MSTCRFVASDQPRTVCPNDHKPREAMCEDCSACPHDHCRVCRHAHAEGTCGECLAEVRENLGEIRRMCGDLPEEAEVRGVEGEAAMLLGPSADPEAWGHREASARVGRIPADYLETARDEAHPLWVLGTWSMAYREAFEHDEPTARVDVISEAGYLGRNLTYMATFEHVPFEDLARDLRRCVAHLEAVLHDGEQVDRTRVTCTNDQCKRRPQLERAHGADEYHDRWMCPSCGAVYDDGDYRDAMARQLVHKGAEKFLPLRDAVSTLVAQGRPERTIRKWLAPPDPEHGDLEAVVGGFCEISSHRVWVWWPDLWRLHMTTKTRTRGVAA